MEFFAGHESGQHDWEGGGRVRDMGGGERVMIGGVQGSGEGGGEVHDETSDGEGKGTGRSRQTSSR